VIACLLVCMMMTLSLIAHVLPCQMMQVSRQAVMKMREDKGDHVGMIVFVVVVGGIRDNFLPLADNGFA
jgi:hypothetical protein